MKKQFRLYDIYRAFSIGKYSQIKGINNYSVTKDVYDPGFEICVEFDNRNGLKYQEYCYDEDALKDFVRRVNKQLGNCRKPGKKKREV